MVTGNKSVLVAFPQPNPMFEGRKIKVDLIVPSSVSDDVIHNMIKGTFISMVYDVTHVHSRDSFCYVVRKKEWGIKDDAPSS